MKKRIVKRGAVIIGVVMLISYSEYNGYSVNECQHCVLSETMINGEINDVVLKMGTIKNANNLKWDAQAISDEQGVIAEAEKHNTQDAIAKCLVKLFRHKKIIVDITVTDIAHVVNEEIVPLKKGTTTAMVTVVSNVKTNLRCGPPPRFEDEIVITVE